MISWLVSSLIPLTLVLTLILIVRQPLRVNLDASTVYRLWLLLPLALILYALPMPWQYVGELNNNTIQSYLVKPTHNLTTQFSNHNSLSFWLKALWLTGVTLLCSYWIISHINFYKALKLSSLLNSKMSEKLNKFLPANLVIKQSSHIYSPVLFGLLKQTLIIPEDFDELYSPEQQELIIAHEVCHYAHHHMWTNQVALLLLALFWFHPLAWRAYASFRQDQEHSCDQIVLARRQTKSRIQYCKALVLAAETSPPNAFTLMSFKHNGEQNFMLNRIAQIKAMPINNKLFSTTKLTLVALISTSLLASISYAGNHLKQTSEIEQVQIDAYPVYRIEPKYPIKAAREKIEGSVVLKFDINGEGNTTNIRIVVAKPSEIFDKESIRALEVWRYKATGKTTKDLLVQLDYLMDNSTTKIESLIEQIEVTN